MTDLSAATRRIREQLGGHLDEVAGRLLSYIDTDNARQLLGPALSQLLKRNTAERLIRACLSADVLRMATDVLLADRSISRDELRKCFHLIAFLANQFASARKDFRDFEHLTPDLVGDFVRRYRTDAKPFGYADESTKWAGIEVCKNVHRSCGDPGPLQAFGARLIAWSGQLARIDTTHDSEAAYVRHLRTLVSSQPSPPETAHQPEGVNPGIDSSPASQAPIGIDAPLPPPLPPRNTARSTSVPWVCTVVEDKFANPPTKLFVLKADYRFKIFLKSSSGTLSETFEVGAKCRPDMGVVLLSVSYKGSDWFFLKHGYLQIKTGAESFTLKPIEVGDLVSGGMVMEEVLYSIPTETFVRACGERAVPIRVTGKPFSVEGELGRDELNVLRAFYNNAIDGTAFLDDLTSMQVKKSQGCFVVTASLGDAGHPDVLVLRDFRERYLRSTSCGRWLCAVYAAYGPAAASFIARHDIARRMSRLVIVRPAAFFARLAIGDDGRRIGRS